VNALGNRIPPWTGTGRLFANPDKNMPTVRVSECGYRFVQTSWEIGLIVQEEALTCASPAKLVDIFEPNLVDRLGKHLNPGLQLYAGTSPAFRAGPKVAMVVVYFALEKSSTA
jgi:hypothetical protein